MLHTPRRVSPARVAGVCILFCLLLSMARAQVDEAALAALRAEGEVKGWTFKMDANPATLEPLSNLAGLREPKDWREGARFDSLTSLQVDPPAAFDWRELTGLPPVRDQGGCGGCWAFGTVGPLECNIYIKDGVTTDLAEQWLLDCNTDGYGCNGGWFVHKYHQSTPAACGGSGAVPESEKPYQAAGGSCGGPYSHPYRIESWAYVGNSYSVPTTDQIKRAIMEYGPVGCAVVVDSAFQAYSSGVFNQSAGGDVNHAVVLVGWDDSLGASGAWIMRNSWNTWWGEGGYMYIEYGCSKIGYGANYVAYEAASALTLQKEEDFEGQGRCGDVRLTGIEKVYRLTNNTSQAVQWQFATLPAWLDAAPASGILPSGNGVDILLSPGSGALALGGGDYAGAVRLTHDAPGDAFEFQARLSLVDACVWFDLDSDPGWNCEAGWAFGTPNGGGSEAGDPESGCLGDYVYGFNLMGDYDNNLTPRYLQSSAIDCSGHENLRLHFSRWLGVESSVYDQAAVECSTDGGANWLTIWEHSGPSLDDGRWVNCDYALPAAADGAPSLLLRWRMGPTDSSVSYAGWNIDEILLSGDALPEPPPAPEESAAGVVWTLY